MKTKATCFRVFIIAMLFTIIGKFSNAQTFNCYIANDSLVSPTQYNFEVFILPTSTSFYFRGIQIGLQFNPGFIPAGATITSGQVAGNSQLTFNYIIGTPQWNTTFSCLSIPNNTGGTCSGSPDPNDPNYGGPAANMFMSAAIGPIRIAKYRLTSTLPFNCASPNVTMIRPTDASPAVSIVKMAVTQWDIACAASAISNNGTYTHFPSATDPANTLTNLVNNLNKIAVSATSPASTQLCAGAGSATFSVTASGNGTTTALSYQWMLNGSPLSNNGTYSGVNTNTLNILNPVAGGLITCQVTQCSPTTSTLTSVAANLIVVVSDDGNFCTTDACDPATGVVTHTPVTPTSDNNVCTDDVCDPATGNTLHPNAPNGTPANDGNACTTNDVCQSGVATGTPVNTDDNNACTSDACDPATGTISHTNVTNGTPANDNNACTTNDVCLNGVATGTPVNTDDNNACTTDACDPATGNVSHTNVANGTPANDGNACTINDNCQNGVATGTPVNTDDNNACTADACDPATGTISHTNVTNGTPANDNNACTTGDVCVNGVATGTPVNTSDGNACTNDVCDPATGNITHPNVTNGTPSNDNNACTTNDVCVNGVATGTPVNTNDNNACTTDACDPATGTISHTNVTNGTPSNDNNACTTNDVCLNGTATGTPVNTDDNNSCTTDACNPATGVITHTNVANGTASNDNNACTTNDICVNGVATGTPVNTNDNNGCTTDACDPATGNISHTPVANGTAGNDGNACTTNDICLNGVATGTPVNTDDNNSCTTDACNPATGAITHTNVANGTASNDNNACTTNDVCVNGVATGTPVNTNDNNACTTDACDPATGNISHTNVANGTPSNDGNACTTNDVCLNGVATGTPVNTDDNNSCTTDACNPATGAITHTNVTNGTPANDGNACTTNDICVNGLATGTPVNTNDNDACTTDACNPSTGAITHTPVNINDNNQCTLDACDPIGGITHTPTIISDDNLCTTDACNPATGQATHTPINFNDNNACTTDACDPITGVSHTPVNFDDQNPCTTDGCDPASGPTHVSTFTATATSTPAGCNTGGTASAGPTGTNYSYSWSNGSTSQNLTNIPAGPYTVTVTDIATGCTSTATTTVGSSGGGSASTPGPINGPAIVCKGQRSVVYCVDPVQGATSYLWTLPNGAIGSSTGPCITVRISSRWQGGQICVQSVSSCGTSNPSCLTIIAVSSSPSTPGPITGPIVLCPGQNSDYSILPVPNATSYEWVVTGGLILNTGQGTTMINVTAPAGFVSGQIKVRAVNCKGKSGYRILNVTGLPPALVWDNDEKGDNKTVGVCGGSTYHYDTHYDGISCRVWTAPQGATIYNSATNTSGNPLQVNSSSDGVYITFPAGFTSGTVTVSACNGCGTSAPITLFVRSTPAPPASISGPATGVCNTSGNLYTIASVPGATSYSWTVPAGAQLTSTSNGGKTAKVKFLNNFVSGNICVTANNACGSSSPTCLTVFAVPLSPGPISGSSSVCRSQTNVQYTVSAVAGATSYNWTATNGVQITSGQGTRTVRLRFTSASAASTLLSVRTVNACGQSAATTKTVNINLNCKVAADESVVAIEGNSLNAYPNPTSGKATITFNAISDAKYSLKVIDILGKIMIYENVSATEGYNMKEINLQGVAKGMYMVTLQTEGEQSETLRLIVE